MRVLLAASLAGLEDGERTGPRQRVGHLDALRALHLSTYQPCADQGVLLLLLAARIAARTHIEAHELVVEDVDVVLRPDLVHVAHRLRARCGTVLVGHLDVDEARHRHRQAELLFFAHTHTLMEVAPVRCVCAFLGQSRTLIPDWRAPAEPCTILRSFARKVHRKS